MDIHSIRNELRMKSIYDIELRVTYYARVSSDSDEQLNSLGNQISYYEDFIKKIPAWTFVPGYIDEGLSGISTKHRERFNQMVADAHDGLFDLIITKEISRFARNTLDSLQYTRQLLSYGVGVFFQNDNINTLDEDSELRLSIMSSIAQDELRKLSSRVKFGHQQAIKQKVVLGNSRIFGYRKDDKRLVIDEEQAEMVRELYKLYATDEYSLKQIETIFYERGYRNYHGKKIAHSTMAGIIANPKYKGYYVGNKVKIIDMFTKKQKFLPPEEWVMFKDETGEIVPAIVAEDLWDRANAVLRRRSEDVKSRQGQCNHANLLTGKLICAECSSPFYRRDSKDKAGNTNSKWICAGKINNGADSCPTFAIYEEELKPILYRMLCDTKADSAALVEEYTQMYRSMDNADGYEKQIEALREKLDVIARKKSKLLEYNVTGKLSDHDFLTMNKQCEADMTAAEAELRELEEKRMSQGEFRRRMEEMRRALERAEADAASGMITKDFVDRYIDKIFVSITEDGSARLEIKIFTGRVCESYLRRLECRAGHTSKKMIMNAENSMKTNG